MVCFPAPLFALGHFGGAFWGSPNLEGSRILEDAKMISQRLFLPFSKIWKSEHGVACILFCSLFKRLGFNTYYGLGEV